MNCSSRAPTVSRRPGRPRGPALLILCLAFSPFRGFSGPLPECPPLVTLEGKPPTADGAADSGQITMVSLNLHDETRSEVFLAGLHKHPELAQADVFLLQEVVHDSADLLGNLSRELNYHYAFGSTQQCGPDCNLGLAFLSRYPLHNFRVLSLPRNDLQYNQRCRIALASTIETPDGAWALFNLHLDTRINANRRVRQLGPVLKSAGEDSLPTVIGGDFNTADLLWIKSVLPLPWLQLQKRAVRKAMESHGFSTPFVQTGPTFNRFPLKLDWIFLRGLGLERFGLTRVGFTDHKALWVVLEQESQTTTGADP